MLLLKKYKILITISILLSITGLGVFFLYRPQEDIITKKDEFLHLEKEEEIEDEVVPKEYYTVDIKGAVTIPGVYDIEIGSRVSDVIKKAGGLTKLADTYYINLSKKISDEMVIIVYTKAEILDYKKKIKEDAEVTKKLIEENQNDAVACENKDYSQDSKDELINLNQATIEQLMILSGIGEAKAKDIINYRQQNDGFKSIEELKNVSGIGDSTFDKIKDYITI